MRNVKYHETKKYFDSIQTLTAIQVHQLQLQLLSNISYSFIRY